MMFLTSNHRHFSINKISVALLCFIVLGANSAFAQQETPSSYIEKYSALAIKAMKEYGIPASIILAIAMHESANGNSKVATRLNNHFGIKGPNNSKAIKSAYKGYESTMDSYDDFIAYVKRRKQFHHLFDNLSRDDYGSWAKGIAAGGYAQSKTWASKIISIIQKHELHELDRADSLSTLTYVIHDTRPNTSEDQVLAIEKTYIVKKGDTLSGIARKHHTSVSSIKTRNGLTSDKLKIGQSLTILP